MRGLRAVLLGLMAPLVVAWLIAAGTPVGAQNSSLIQLKGRDALLGWEAVGRVVLGQEGYCTGVLIASDLVLTAAHCVFDTQGRPRPSDTMRFSAGERDGASVAERGVAAAQAHPAFHPRDSDRLRQIQNDVALLRLDRPISTTDADPFAVHGAGVNGADLSVVSYGRGRDTTLSWQRQCNLLDRHQQIMVFDCDVTFGSSGSPVFLRNGQRARVLTLVSSGGAHDGRMLAFGMELAPRLAETKRALRQAETAVSRPVVIGAAPRTSAPVRKDIGARFIRP